jgi:branched-chain amino acid aminotransferase
MTATRATTTTVAKQKAKAGFGVVFADEILVGHYQDGRWSDLAIEPYGPITLDPATACLHYGQTIFEGLKGHRQPDGDTAIFRLLDHMERFNRSAARMSMPALDPEQAARGILELVARHTHVTPEAPGSLYIRPMMLASSVGLGVKPADRYRYMVLLSPVQSYFGGKTGIRLRTEERYVRAAPGGTGTAKCGGNYASSLIAQQAVVADGFDQVLWLDAIEHRKVEELSAMNFLIVDDGVLVSPPPNDTVLPSITNRSIFTLAEDLGIPAERRVIDIEDVGKPTVSEVFCCGTAAVITPVYEVTHQGRSLFKTEKAGPIGARLFDTLTAIQQGRAADDHGWRTPAGNPALPAED